MLLARKLQRHFAADHEQRAFGLRIGLGLLAAATGRKLDKIVRERLGKARERTGQHPHTRAVPMRQIARDDVADHALGDHGIGFGEHRPPGQELGLAGVSCWRHMIGTR